MAITIKLAAAIVTASVLYTGDPVLLMGDPGIGKSEVVEQVARELGWSIKKFMPSQSDPTDVKGVPFVHMLGETEEVEAATFAVRAVTLWAQAGFLPVEERDGEYGIFFIDELSTASPQVQAACYQLALERRVGDYVIPPGWFIVSAANPVGIGAVAYKIATPLANRFEHHTVVADIDSWMEWAFNEELDYRVISYLRQHPQHLSTFDPRSAQQELAFASPRTWTFVSRILTYEEKMSREVRDAKIRGCIGGSTGNTFVNYINNMNDMPDLMAVLSGDDPSMTNDPSLYFACITSLVSIISQNAGSQYASDYITNAIEWARKMSEEEYTTLFVKDLSTVKKLQKSLVVSDGYRSWAAANGDVLSELSS